MDLSSHLVPTGERIIIKKMDGPKEVRSAGGIVLPGDERSAFGQVCAVGPGVLVMHEGNWYHRPVCGLLPHSDGFGMLSVGDVVAYSRHAGEVFEFEREEFLVLYETDVLAVMARQPTPQADSDISESGDLPEAARQVS